MKCASIEILDDNIARLRLEVHACRCHDPARGELPGIGNVSQRCVSGKLRLGAGELKPAGLTDHTAAAVATYEPFARKSPIAGFDYYLIRGLTKARNSDPASDHYTEGFCAAGQYRLKLLYFGHQAGVGRARQAIFPLCGINIPFMKWDAGEMSYLAAGSLFGILVGILQALVQLELSQQSPPVKRFNCRGREPPYPKRNPLERRVRIRCLFQYKDRTIGQRQLAGEE
jgi:hypothetical protein